MQKAVTGIICSKFNVARSQLSHPLLQGTVWMPPHVQALHSNAALARAWPDWIRLGQGSAAEASAHALLQRLRACAACAPHSCWIWSIRLPWHDAPGRGIRGHCGCSRAHVWCLKAGLYCTFKRCMTSRPIAPAPTTLPDAQQAALPPCDCFGPASLHHIVVVAGGLFA